MSDPSAGTAGESAAAPKPRKEFKHPALQAMGIPRIRVPSRNWMIFWALTGSITGLYVYDRRERRRIRDQWKEKVSYLAKEKMEPTEMPRKVTVYVAPPPGDYLEEGFAHFRQYVKPLLTAAAIDFTVKSAKRQGEIRSAVAEDIRNIRRAELGLPLSYEDDKDELDRFIQSKIQKSDIPGGVICVGRGAYKEYMNGLHEGWLGPLEAPVELLQENGTQETTVSEFPDREKDMKDIFGELKEEKDNVKDHVEQKSEPKELKDELTVGTLDENIQSDNRAVPEIEDNKEEKAENEDGQEKEKEKKEKPVPKPYIKIPEYANLETPAEFERLSSFEPIAAIGQPHLLGFLNTPFRIYRFFNRRKLADDMGRATSAVVFGHYGAFDMTQGPDALLQEEDDWPSKWKKKGKESNSEWMWDFKIDERIGNKLTVYQSSQSEATNSYGDPVAQDM
jgi:mitochondrial import inner membrane translocase subunit TIM54